MRNILITIAYDGRQYHGWQIQKNAVSVQEVFQNKLEKIIGIKADLKGCSRTDSGVHANMYCISVKTEHKIPCENLTRALNTYLPKDICVKECRDVPLDFHARYSCKAKEYVYKIYNDPIRNPFLNGLVFHYWYKLDEMLLNDASKHFVGKHDFTSFCTIDQRERRNMTRTIKYFNVQRQNNMVLFTVCADGFLYNMVRIMVGTLLRIAQGKFNACDIDKIIMAKDRFKAGPTAQSQGLYLNRVFYDEKDLQLF